jgi:2-polyprenyl-3-methyl-5-hydroxy-6-metoxy-1,4-benzoquinol methylase
VIQCQACSKTTPKAAEGCPQSTVRSAQTRSLHRLRGNHQRMPEYVACNLCGRDDTKLLFSLRDYRLRIDDRLWNVVECRHCHLGYLNPRPTPREIGVYYPGSYFDHRPAMSRRYARQAAYLPSTPGELLDIGAARGDFMAVMKDRGWSVTGIESADAGNPHELSIHGTSFPDQNELPDERFDVITAWAVFEHLHDPSAAFRRVTQLLRPEGTFIVQVPNLNSLNSRYARLEDVPRHLYFFSPRTLSRYATQSGLRLRQVHHVTDLYGGSGRGVLRHALTRAVGRSTDDFFAFYRSGRRQRFRRAPMFAAAWTVVGGLERILLTDWLVRALRISGQIVAIMDRPARDVR